MAAARVASLSPSPLLPFHVDPALARERSRASLKSQLAIVRSVGGMRSPPCRPPGMSPPPPGPAARLAATAEWPWQTAPAQKVERALSPVVRAPVTGFGASPSTASLIASLAPQTASQPQAHCNLQTAWPPMAHQAATRQSNGQLSPGASGRFPTGQGLIERNPSTPSRGRLLSRPGTASAPVGAASGRAPVGGARGAFSSVCSGVRRGESSALRVASPATLGPPLGNTPSTSAAASADAAMVVHPAPSPQSLEEARAHLEKKDAQLAVLTSEIAKQKEESAQLRRQFAQASERIVQLEALLIAAGQPTVETEAKPGARLEDIETSSGGASSASVRHFEMEQSSTHSHLGGLQNDLSHNAVSEADDAADEQDGGQSVELSRLRIEASQLREHLRQDIAPALISVSRWPSSEGLCRDVLATTYRLAHVEDVSTASPAALQRCCPPPNTPHLLSQLPAGQTPKLFSHSLGECPSPCPESNSCPLVPGSCRRVPQLRSSDRVDMGGDRGLCSGARQDGVSTAAGHDTADIGACIAGIDIDRLLNRTAVLLGDWKGRPELLGRNDGQSY